MDMINFQIVNLLIVSAFTEACVETTKSFTSARFTDSGNKVIAFVCALVLSFATDTSVLNGTGAVYVLGIILSAAIVSRGSNYIHDFSTLLEGIARAAKTTGKK